ncbi:DNA polymerase I [Snodgrassella communis]|nr:DNA polymerase I [Snodgrassella communis]PIT10287.1 DNA polymerase I [Snodgrassella communis]PIT26761.1 DNA polymerase I [Snodgrassella communis]PIT29821.1 DNA polymerase I [Snodgrassella communis]PIT34247.1 DNA polymerase I [Snodgrassella communis]
MQKTLLLVDGSSYLYRAFHALAPLTSPTGMPTGALYGVLNMLRRLRLDTPHDYACCVFDAKGENFRHQLFPEYKANRPPMPEDLRPQAEALPELVKLMGWPVLSINGVEADDVIGTLACCAQKSGYQVIISTGDKDMAQLVNDQITLVNTMSNEKLDSIGVLEKFGVKPEQIIDYLSLIGDKVDNVPGVDKCGPKTAVKWLQEYGNLQKIIEHANDIKGKVGENLRIALPNLPLSYQLITIKTDIDLQQELPHGLEDLKRHTPSWAELIPHFQQLGFKNWLKEAQTHSHENTTISQPADDLFAEIKTNESTDNKILTNTSAADYLKNIPKQYSAITTVTQLTELQKQLEIVDTIALDTETDSLDAMNASLVGISIALEPGKAFYIPVGHSPTAVSEQLPLEMVLNVLKPYLEADKPGKIGQNIKYDQHILANYSIDLKGITGDSMLASYIVESHLGHGLDELALRHLDWQTIHYEDLCGKGAKQISFADVALEDAVNYAAEDADVSLRLEILLKEQMDEAQLKLYHELEIPVENILYIMERTGVLIDRQELAQQSHELGTQLVSLEEQAYQLAGQPFNLNSPKQLQSILFEKMAIPTSGLKKTASGGISTNEIVLEKLAADYPLPKLILQTRSLAKLKSTYTDKLPQLINPHTGRVHTTYAQAVAITGRLASNNPNLQNIPVRTEEGRRIRRSFIAPPDQLIVSADYSQIELRIMAHLSNDATLIDAFQKNEDIHKRTAAEIFASSQELITAEQRRYAKTINFGLIYGMSEYGLAKSLGIELQAAQHFISRYFSRYPGVHEYMEKTKELALQRGFVETLFGRRLYLPDLKSSNGAVRAGAFRAAINAPMQGTASDLIKRAMLAVQSWLEQKKMQTKLIMQVHDELVLQVPTSELATLQAHLPELMSGVAQLKVPLIADLGTGYNWDEAH